MKIKALLIIILSLAACISKKDCELDLKFKNEFDRNIQILEHYSKGLSEEESKKVLDAVSYLNSITRIESSIYLGDVIIYEPEEFVKDKKLWTSWYKKNKCHMTTSIADSLYETNSQMRPNYTPK